jgi:DNA-binding CsgD family transcriptional regulator
MDALSIAIGEAARATTLDEIGEIAFPALARAIDACPVFLARADADLIRSQAIAGEHRDTLARYLRHYLAEDPLCRRVRSATAPIEILQRHVDRRTLHASRAYQEFHRIYDFEHHMLVRFLGVDLATPGALAMGFTRGRRLRAFAARETAIVTLALPAFHGAAQRIVRAHEPAPPDVAAVATRNQLTRGESDVLAQLALGLSNAEIASRLHVSVETVKTHVSRVLRKLGVPSRARALVLLRCSS